MKETTIYLHYFMDEALHVIQAIDAIALSDEVEFQPDYKFAALKMLRNRLLKAYRKRFNSEDTVRFPFPVNRKDELLEDLNVAKAWLEREQIDCKTLLQKAFWLQQEAYIDEMGGRVVRLTEFL